MEDNIKECGAKKIGNVRIDTPFVLAPMAGVNCAAFRLLCREYGAGLIYTQMYHCDFLAHKVKEDGEEAVFDFVNIQKGERPVSLQLVGNNPEKMAAAAALFEKKADIIDINMGCPEENITKTNAGAYFAKYPEKAEDIIKAVVDSVKIPVSAKIRIGWDSQSINAVAVAERLENLGISALAVHGRTAVQGFKGKANLEIIKHIKNKISIPVIGNGGISSSFDAVEMLKKTDCDFAMIGRRAMGDPGIFRRCNNRYFKKNDSIPEAKELFIKFADYYQKYDMDKSFTEFRAHALWFAKRAKMGPKIRQEICRIKDRETILEYFK